MRSRPTLLVVAVVAAALAVALPAAAQAAKLKPGPRIDVLSDRADVISGGDALVGIRLPKGLKASKVTVDRKSVV